MTRPGAPSRVKLLVLLAIMLLLWAANFVVAKIALRDFPPMLAAGLRLVLAGLLILPVYAWDGRRRAHRWQWGDLPRLLLLGGFGIAGNQVLFLIGLERTTAAHAALMFGLTPILVLLIAVAIRQERLTFRKLAGMLVALAGVLALQTSGSAADSASTLYGDLLVLAGVSAFALFTVFGKPATAIHGAITVNSVGYVSGGLVLAPVVWWWGAGFAFSEVSATGWASLLYMALFPSVVCYLIYYYALTYLAASRLATLAYIQPVLATMIAIPVLGENVTYSLVFGGLLVLGGVYITERG